MKVFICTFLNLYRSYPLVLLQHYKSSDCKKEALRFLLYLSLYGFYIDMPEDGLSTGRNM